MNDPVYLLELSVKRRREETHPERWDTHMESWKTHPERWKTHPKRLETHPERWVYILSMVAMASL